MLQKPWSRRICHWRRKPPRKHFCRQWRHCVASTTKIYDIYQRCTNYRATRIWPKALPWCSATLHVVYCTNKNLKTGTMTCWTQRKWKHFARSLKTFKSVEDMDMAFSAPFLFPPGTGNFVLVKKSGKRILVKQRWLRRSKHRCLKVVSTVTICETTYGSANGTRR